MDSFPFHKCVYNGVHCINGLKLTVFYDYVFQNCAAHNARFGRGSLAFHVDPCEYKIAPELN